MIRPATLAALLALGAASALPPMVSAQDEDPAHPGQIHARRCARQGDAVATLAEASRPLDASRGPTSAIPVRVSITAVRIRLADLLADRHRISFREGGDRPGQTVVCGDLGGPIMAGTDLVVGLAEQNDSGHSGVAWLHGDGRSTTVYAFLMEPNRAAGAAGSPSPGESQSMRFSGEASADFEPRSETLLLAGGDYVLRWSAREPFPEPGICGVTIGLHDPAGEYAAGVAGVSTIVSGEDHGEIEYRGLKAGDHELFVYDGCPWTVEIFKRP